MDPVDDARARLNELRNALLGLHGTLLGSERAFYERDIAPIPSRQQLLQLVLHDPWFAWLHELSELVVLIDETLDTGQAAIASDGARLAGQARGLLSPHEDGDGFGQRYYQALQRDPDVVVAHGAIMKLLRAME